MRKTTPAPRPATRADDRDIMLDAGDVVVSAVSGLLAIVATGTSEDEA